MKKWIVAVGLILFIFGGCTENNTDELTPLAIPQPLNIPKLFSGALIRVANDGKLVNIIPELVKVCGALLTVPNEEPNVSMLIVPKSVLFKVELVPILTKPELLISALLISVVAPSIILFGPFIIEIVCSLVRVPPPVRLFVFH